MSDVKAQVHMYTEGVSSYLSVWFAAIILFLFSTQNAAAQEDYLTSFSDPALLWGNGIERVIEEAYRQFFITRIIGGRVMNIRLPFAMNSERDAMLETGIEYIGGGKAGPQTLWPVIEEILESQDFADYINALSSGREKIIIFDIPEQRWTMSTDLFLIARMKSGSYSGLPHRPYVLASGRGALESDVYNYLYCIGSVGIDCSGFVWQILTYIAEAGGINLGSVLSPVLGVPRGGDPAKFAGTSFFASPSAQILTISDEIRNLQPADILLFRDIDGVIGHSAIIQSIDWSRGIIRYLHCTNIASPEERGVHDSYIYFDPSNTAVSLKDSSLRWTKKRFGAFPGEAVDFIDDGERFRYRLNGGGRVVRIRALVSIIDRLGR